MWFQGVNPGANQLFFGHKTHLDIEIWSIEINILYILVCFMSKSHGGQNGSWSIGYDAFNLINVFWAYAESFSHFGQDILHQDSTCPPSIHLESWRTVWFLTNSQWMLFGLQLYLQHVQEISSNSNMNPVKTNYPRSLTLEAWMTG